MIYALPGFLGQTSDWDFLDLDVLKLTIYKYPKISLWEWAKCFNQSISQPSVLLGYSMGGRLALHTLLDKPNQWKAAVFVSTHLGLSCLKSKEERIQLDQHWASRFLTEPWDPLMNAWNAQPIFKNTEHPIRLDSNYNRKQLSLMLKDWSLGYQDNLEKALQTQSIPIFWIVGASDTNYVNRAKTLLFSHPKSTVWIAPNGGHRLLWDAPQHLNKQIKQFLQGII